MTQQGLLQRQADAERPIAWNEANVPCRVDGLPKTCAILVFTTQRIADVHREYMLLEHQIRYFALTKAKFVHPNKPPIGSGAG
jgi:hypothetical protein